MQRDYTQRRWSECWKLLNCVGCVYLRCVAVRYGKVAASYVGWEPSGNHVVARSHLCPTGTIRAGSKDSGYGCQPHTGHALLPLSPKSGGLPWIHSLFFSLAVTHGLRDLSSLTRDQTPATTVKAPGPNQWTAREFPILDLVYLDEQEGFCLASGQLKRSYCLLSLFLLPNLYGAKLWS